MLGKRYQPADASPPTHEEIERAIAAGNMDEDDVVEHITKERAARVRCGCGEILPLADLPAHARGEAHRAWQEYRREHALTETASVLIDDAPRAARATPGGRYIVNAIITVEQRVTVVDAGMSSEPYYYRAHVTAGCPALAGVYYGATTRQRISELIRDDAAQVGYLNARLEVIDV